jgi:hypothetical protein
MDFKIPNEEAGHVFYKGMMLINEEINNGAARIPD